MTEPDVRLRCQCPALGAACVVRATAEDLRCDACRNGRCNAALGSGDDWVHLVTLGFSIDLGPVQSGPA